MERLGLATWPVVPRGYAVERCGNCRDTIKDEVFARPNVKYMALTPILRRLRLENEINFPRLAERFLFRVRHELS